MLSRWSVDWEREKADDSPIGAFVRRWMPLLWLLVTAAVGAGFWAVGAAAGSAAIFAAVLYVLGLVGFYRPSVAKTTSS